MLKSVPKLASSPPRSQVVVRVEVKQPIFNPYAQCMCHLDFDAKREPIFLYHESGRKSSHLPDCLRLRTEPSKTSRKRKSQDKPAPNLDLGEDEGGEFRFTADIRNENIRRQRKETKRIREAEARAEAMIATKLAPNPYAQCHCCDALSDPRHEAARDRMRTIRRTHTDGSITLHLPNCFAGGHPDFTAPRQTYNDPAKWAAYIGLEENEETKKLREWRQLAEQEKQQMIEAHNRRLRAEHEKEQMTEIRKKNQHTRRPPKETKNFKSVAYINLEEEEEEEGGENGRPSPAAKRYDPRTIVSDFLRAIGEHPYLPPLNAHMEEFPTQPKGRGWK